MPEMDGFEATRLLRAREGEPGREPPSGGQIEHVPIVAMTAHAMKGDRERCLEAGMDDYVSKPLQVDKLLAVLARLAPVPQSAPQPVGGGNKSFLSDSPLPLAGEGLGVGADPEPAADLVPAEEPADDSEPALPVFDAAAALDRVDDDRELLVEILGLFREQAAPGRAEIEDALARRDGPALERAAHSLKGAAGNISAEQVREASLRLEHAGRAGEWDAASAAWADLAAALPRLDAALTEFEKS